MERFILALACLAVVSACADSSGNPLIGSDPGGATDETPTDESTEGLPASLSKNLSSISEPDGSNVTVNMSSLDTTPVEATFVRRSDLDTNGYVAYAVQEDPLDRLFIALTKTSADNSTRAAVVQDGGQFNRYLDGGFYARIGPYNPPPVLDEAGSGQVSYAGDYAGFTNSSRTNGAGLLPIPGSVDPTTLPDLPGEAVRVTGLIFLNANFADGVINGEIYNRDRIDPSDGSVIDRQPNIELIVADIAEDGTFFGDAEIEGDVGTDSGDYGGIFGGTNAASVSGIVALDNYNNNIEDELEIGVFVLTQCGRPDDADICDIVEP